MRFSYIFIIILNFCFLFGVTSCSKKQSESGANPTEKIINQVGVSAEVLVQKIGEPVEIIKSQFDKKTEVYQYPDNSKYQIQNNKVTGQFIEPTGDESSLQYWRHQWVGKHTSYELIPSTQDHRGNGFYSFKNTDDKISVIYDQSLNKVVRIVHY